MNYKEIQSAMEMSSHLARSSDNPEGLDCILYGISGDLLIPIAVGQETGLPTLMIPVEMIHCMNYLGGVTESLTHYNEMMKDWLGWTDGLTASPAWERLVRENTPRHLSFIERRMQQEDA